MSSRPSIPTRPSESTEERAPLPNRPAAGGAAPSGPSGRRDDRGGGYSNGSYRGGRGGGDTGYGDRVYDDRYRSGGMSSRGGFTPRGGGRDNGFDSRGEYIQTSQLGEVFMMIGVASDENFQ